MQHCNTTPFYFSKNKSRDITLYADSKGQNSTKLNNLNHNNTQLFNYYKINIKIIHLILVQRKPWCTIYITNQGGSWIWGQNITGWKLRLLKTGGHIDSLIINSNVSDSHWKKSDARNQHVKLKKEKLKTNNKTDRHGSEWKQTKTH